MPKTDAERQREYLSRKTEEELAEIRRKKREYMRRWNATPVGKATRRRRRLASYGLTEETFQLLWDQQMGRCRICQIELAGGYHVEHDHETGKVRGLTCGKCNVGLGMFKDDPELLEAAAAYLRETA